jgi:O-antigen ligase
MTRHPTALRIALGLAALALLAGHVFVLHGILSRAALPAAGAVGVTALIGLKHFGLLASWFSRRRENGRERR